MIKSRECRAELRVSVRAVPKGSQLDSVQIEEGLISHRVRRAHRRSLFAGCCVFANQPLHDVDLSSRGIFAVFNYKRRGRRLTRRQRFSNAAMAGLVRCEVDLKVLALEEDICAVNG